MPEQRPDQVAGAEAVVRFRRDLAEESDRAAVLIAGALLENALTALLQSALVPNPSALDTLFDGAVAPLGSFSAKIDLAFRIGAISPQLSRDLHLIRRIRNEFAHRPAACQFEDQDIRSRILELSKSHGIFQRSPKWIAENGAPSLRAQFIEAVSWMSFYLNAQSMRAVRMSSRLPEFGYEFSYDKDETPAPS